MATELAGRVVVVTGAGRGMGRAYARAFLEEGARVVALNRSWDPAGYAASDDRDYLAELTGHDNVLLVTADIGDEDEVQRAFDASMERFGTVDALVNNAGWRMNYLFPPEARLTTLELNTSHYERMFRVNFFGTLNVTRRFIQPMIEKRRGSIVTVATTGVVLKPEGEAHVLNRPSGREQPYMASKAGIAIVMMYLADEMREHNVAVNVANPAFSRPSAAAAPPPPAPSGAPPAAGGGRPLRSEHAVPLVRFLAQQDATGGVTGKIFEATRWNRDHGFGDTDQWLAADP